MLIDTHAHLDDQQFEGSRDEVVRAAAAAGVNRIICIGTTASASQRCVDLARQYPGVTAAVGIQPNYTAEAADGDWERIVSLAIDECVVAIGETGLDYYWDHADLETQEASFRRHLELSFELQKPFVVHMREPAEDRKEDPSVCSRHIARVIRELSGGGSVAGVMHSYTGNREYAEEFLDLGMHISFAGMVTFKKSAVLRDVAKSIPLDRLLIETDSPYLSPEPVRGKRPNEPAHLIHTAECLATLLGIPLRTLAETTSHNACRLFGLQDGTEAVTD